MSNFFFFCILTKQCVDVEKNEEAEGGMLSVTKRIVCSTSSDWITYMLACFSLSSIPTHTYIQLKNDKRRKKEGERT